MRVVRFSDIAAFSQRVEPYLVAHEAQHCLQLGILSTLLRQPDAFAGGEDAALLLAVVEQESDGAIALVALQTPPHNLILSRATADDVTQPALGALVAELHAQGHKLPGVHGAAALSKAFADEWHRVTGQTSVLALHERIYQLDTVVPVRDVPGTLRPATTADRATLEQWISAFFAEALPKEAVRIDAAAWVAQNLESSLRKLMVWEQRGQLVTMVGYSGKTPNGMRIGPVYTPPEARRHGYGSAATAATSQALLDEGCRHVFLFTNLNNPTSNHIYQTIGYRPIDDVDVYKFSDAE